MMKGSLPWTTWARRLVWFWAWYVWEAGARRLWWKVSFTSAAYKEAVMSRMHEMWATNPLSAQWANENKIVLYSWSPCKASHRAVVVCRASHMDESATPLAEWQDSVHTWSAYVSHLRSVYMDITKQAFLGSPVCDVDLVKLDGTQCRLFDFLTFERPLVLNFGSCS